MKQIVSTLKNVENCKVGKRTGCKPNSKKQAKEQGRSSLLKLLGWGCISPLFREIKETGSNSRAQSWPGIWGSADWKHLISGQVEHSQGHKSYSSFAWLMWRSGQEWLHLELKKCVSTICMISSGLTLYFSISFSSHIYSVRKSCWILPQVHTEHNYLSSSLLIPSIYHFS